jgi:hypothetical protein
LLKNDKPSFLCTLLDLKSSVYLLKWAFKSFCFLGEVRIKYFISYLQRKWIEMMNTTMEIRNYNDKKGAHWITTK